MVKRKLPPGVERGPGTAETNATTQGHRCCCTPHHKWNAKRFATCKDQNNEMEGSIVGAHNPQNVLTDHFSAAKAAADNSGLSKSLWRQQYRRRANE